MHGLKETIALQFAASFSHGTFHTTVHHHLATGNRIFLHNLHLFNILIMSLLPIIGEKINE